MTYESRNRRDAEDRLVSDDDPKPKVPRSTEYDDDFTDQQ